MVHFFSVLGVQSTGLVSNTVSGPASVLPSALTSTKRTKYGLPGSRSPMSSPLKVLLSSEGDG